MKKLLIILLILFLLVAAGIAVFIATFDAERYRPVVVKKLEEALGRPVRVDRISLRWERGIAAELRGIAILPDRDPSSKPALEAASISIQLQFQPLFYGEVQIGSVVVQGLRASLIRRADGTVEVPGLFPPPEGPFAAPPVLPPTGNNSPTIAPLLIRDLELLEGTLMFRDETLRPPLQVTLERVKLRMALDLGAEQVDIRQASANIGEGVISAAGVVRNFRVRPDGELRLTVQDVRLENLFPPTEGQPGLQGKLTGAFAAQLEGRPAGADPIEGLTLQGRLRVQDGRISNFNLLREALVRLTVIPGLSESLLARLPPSYAEKLEAKDTTFRPLDMEFTLKGGAVSFKEFHVSTDSFDLLGTARIGLDGGLHVPAKILVEPELSAAFIQSVEELKYVAEGDRIVLPVIVEGSVQKPNVRPDLQYVAGRLFSGQGQSLLGDLLNEVLD